MTLGVVEEGEPDLTEPEEMAQTETRQQDTVEVEEEVTAAVIQQAQQAAQAPMVGQEEPVTLMVQQHLLAVWEVPTQMAVVVEVVETTVTKEEMAAR